jgi:Ca2+-binding RTX toxin-like protein
MPRSACAIAVAVILATAGVASVDTSSADAHGPGHCKVSHGVSHKRDVITGTAGADTIDCSRAKRPHSIYGLGGDDTIIGGLADDFIYAGDGNDWADAGPGADYVDGGIGDDTLFGGDGDDSILGGSGDDELQTGPGANFGSGGLGDDLVVGSAGTDFLIGGQGADTLEGHEGDDVLVADDREAPDFPDSIDGGEGPLADDFDDCYGNPQSGTFVDVVDVLINCERTDQVLSPA